MTARDPPAGIADRYPALTYTVLALGLSWALWIPAFATNSVEAIHDPALVLGAFGPFVAAAAVTRLRGESVRGWLRAAVGWRRPVRWYVAAVGVPLGAAAVAAALAVALVGDVDVAATRRVLSTLPVGVLFVTLVGGGQEEFGWRGFALPHLQERFDALTASVVVGVAWALWHAPLFVFDVYTHSALAYALLVVAYAIVFTWYYNRSRGCLPGAMLMHGTINAAVANSVMVAGGPERLPLSATWLYAAVLWPLALGLLAVYGRETLAGGRRVRPTWTRQDGSTGAPVPTGAAGEVSD